MALAPRRRLLAPATIVLLLGGITGAVAAPPPYEPVTTDDPLVVTANPLDFAAYLGLEVSGDRITIGFEDVGAGTTWCRGRIRRIWG